MTIFGIFADLPFVTAHTTFIGFLIFLVLLEYFFEWLEEMAEHVGIELLFEKMKKELMFMGLISFIVFIYTLIAQPAATDYIFLSFEMSHMIFFFMAIAFIIQALFLTSYASTTGKKFIMALRTSTKVLLDKYDKIEGKSRDWWWFHSAPSYLPAYPHFRSTIEFRIIERLFIYQHQLSPGK